MKLFTLFDVYGYVSQKVVAISVFLSRALNIFLAQIFMLLSQLSHCHLISDSLEPDGA